MTDIVERLRNFGNSGSILTEAAAEIERLRETNTRLNRRCQQYESAVAEKVRIHPDGSLGRSLANAEAARLRDKLESLTTPTADMKARAREISPISCDFDPDCWAECEDCTCCNDYAAGLKAAFAEGAARERERLLSLFDGKMVVTLRWVRHMIGLPAEEAAKIKSRTDG